MANNITKVSENGTEVSRTEQHTDSDSLMIKKDAQGRMSWEIKHYTNFSDVGAILEATDVVDRVHELLRVKYPNP